MGDIGGGDGSLLITDVTICFSSPSTREQELLQCSLGSPNWQRLDKDLYLHGGRQLAFIHAETKDEQELKADDLVVREVRVGKEPPARDGRESRWEQRPGGIWLLRSEFGGDTSTALKGLDVLFGTDAVDPRPLWHLMDAPLELDASPQTPVARLTFRHQRLNSGPNLPELPLRANADGKFKVVQVSDTHMVTGVGVCKDAIDADGQPLPAGEADPRTVQFLEAILETEKPDLVILTGDQLHHDHLDTQSALFKVVAPLIERKIPYAAVFGNHDDEGTWAMSRAAQMSILQDLPYSLCEPGPTHVDGVGNYHLQIVGPGPSQQPSLTFYLLDSHGEAANPATNPDYEPIKQSQIDWFRDTSKALQKERKKSGTDEPHLSLAFMHIPIPEYTNSDLAIAGGQRREPTEGSSVNTHLYDAMVREGVVAVGNGHDHVNDFCGLLPRSHEDLRDSEKHVYGPWLCYNGGSGFGGYMSYGKNRYHRRLRVWGFDTTRANIRTWKRLEYHSERVDEMMLVEDGAVVPSQM
ncbi:hypothetical protein LTR85_002705 [Meristemomyces frigidus]|nr:hypothetical protein LTR85_002705 [Meristemomyces frigidus]